LMFCLPRCPEGGLCGLDVEVGVNQVQIKCPRAEHCKEHNQFYKKDDIQDALAQNNFVMRPSRARLAAKGIVPKERLVPGPPPRVRDDDTPVTGPTNLDMYPDLKTFLGLSALGIITPTEASAAAKAVAAGRAPDFRERIAPRRGWNL
jgi:phage FluMu protein Com